MASASPALVEAGRDNIALPQESLLPRPGSAGPGAEYNDTTAWWVLDVSGARGMIASIVDGTGPLNWVEALLASIRIADVDQNTVHLVGPYGGRKRMIGQPLTAYAPREGWTGFAELILAAVANHPPGAARTREITSIAFADCVIGISTDDAHPDIVFLSVDGTVTDDRSFWSVRASEERYRNLIHYLPRALVQVDSTPMTAIFDELRRRGVTDIARYLDEAPELPLHSRNIVQVTDANRDAVQLFAADSPDQLIGPVDFLFTASPDTAKRVITAHFEGRRNYIEVMKLRTLDGRLRDVELSVTYPTPPDRLDVTILGFEDITDRLRTEAQLRQLQADYSRAARISMLGELATSIAHEVNQPLAAIVTNAETSLRWLSREDPNLAKVGQLTTRIAENARRASNIVQRIRGMAARREPERVPLDLNEIIEEALLFVRYEIESRSIDLSTSLDPSLPKVLGDRVQLQQVVVNLLVNAVQAQNGPGRIELSTATGENGEVIFSIHDGGPGIAEENLDRIFGTFFTTKDDGIGIGLALCQSIIAAHGGTITASNHPEGGALFQFSLPAVAKV
jgi:signal transduction histidine kinase